MTTFDLVAGGLRPPALPAAALISHRTWVAAACSGRQWSRRAGRLRRRRSTRGRGARRALQMPPPAPKDARLRINPERLVPAGRAHTELLSPSRSGAGHLTEQRLQGWFARARWWVVSQSVGRTRGGTAANAPRPSGWSPSGGAKITAGSMPAASIARIAAIRRRSAARAAFCVAASSRRAAL